VNVVSVPASTGTAPDGVIAPFDPALAVIVCTNANEAAIVWLAVMLASVWLVTAPTDAPSTSTSSTA
jgi:hypothetical protein